MAAFSALGPQATALVLGNNTHVGEAGYDLTNAAIPSTFSNNFLVKGDGVGSSSPLNFVNAPYTTIGASLYFTFVLDLQETNNNESLSVDAFELLVNSTVIWSTQEPILVNNGTPLTLTPLGNGADMALFIPVASFNGLNLTGSDTFIVRATHSLSHNGNEEWLFTDRGITTPIQFFGPTDPIFDPSMNNVPEPSTFVLGLLGRRIARPAPPGLKQPRRPARCHSRLQPLPPFGESGRGSQPLRLLGHIESQGMVLLAMLEILR